MPGPQGEKVNKIFNDPIHGSIELHPYLVRIIDTPQFQRLRYIRQMGSVYFVYPGASHNRFEHSIGVAHLAGEMVQALNKQHRDQPDPKLTEKIFGSSDAVDDLISEEEGLCVQIAALCHDLGHGPFSHMFDNHFLPRVAKTTTDKKKKEALKKWTHEAQSQKMLDALLETIKRSGGEDSFTQFMDNHLHFINDLIDPPKPEETKKREKSFLYEIVSNKRNGIDVDKMDYFARDCQNLGIQINFDYKRFFKFARVYLCGNEMQICMRDKEVDHIYELYHTRNNIHKKACQHKVVTAIDEMIVDAFFKADRTLQISDAAIDKEKFAELTDGIYQKILDYRGNKKSMKDARAILQRIEIRNLYKSVLVGRFKTKSDLNKFEKNEKQLAKALRRENIGIRIIKMEYGMGGKNPIKRVKFYTKRRSDKPMRLKKHQVSRLLPSVFHDDLLYIIYKRPQMSDKAILRIKEKAKKWCCDRNYLKN